MITVPDREPLEVVAQYDQELGGFLLERGWTRPHLPDNGPLAFGHWELGDSDISATLDVYAGSRNDKDVYAHLRVSIYVKEWVRYSRDNLWWRYLGPRSSLTPSRPGAWKFSRSADVGRAVEDFRNKFIESWEADIKAFFDFGYVIGSVRGQALLAHTQSGWILETRQPREALAVLLTRHPNNPELPDILAELVWEANQIKNKARRLHLLDSIEAIRIMGLEGPK